MVMLGLHTRISLKSPVNAFATAQLTVNRMYMYVVSAYDTGDGIFAKYIRQFYYGSQVICSATDPRE